MDQLSPSPWGEGRGEGDRDNRQPKPRPEILRSLVIIVMSSKSLFPAPCTKALTAASLPPAPPPGDTPIPSPPAPPNTQSSCSSRTARGFSGYTSRSPAKKHLPPA